MKFIILLLVVISCQKKSDFKITEAIIQEDMNCARFEMSLSQYIVTTKNKTHFVKDEAKALEAISSFKVELTSSRRTLAYFEKLYQDCQKSGGKGLTGCPYHTMFLSFFDKLLEGTKTYKWKPETKLKAIALASSFARFQLKEPQNLNSARSLAKIFERINHYGLLKKDISADINKVTSELEVLHNQQWNKLQKSGIKSCEEALNNYYEEVESGEKSVKKMRAWEEALP